MCGYHLRTAIEDIIVKVGLTEKRDTLSAALSGGMKRKLSLAIALIGDPKFLLLDGEYIYFIYMLIRCVLYILLVYANIFDILYMKNRRIYIILYIFCAY